MKFMKKPVVIEAVQFLGSESVDEMNKTFGISFQAHSTFIRGNSSKKMGLIIHSMEGEMTANIGDWIIQGVKGEHYPCKNDIFEATYEAVI